MRERDKRHRFLIESCDVRGLLVHLDDSWHAANSRTDYPPAIRQLLGEVFVSATLLAGTIKFDGKLTLQVRGNGPIHLMVVQITSDGCMRGLARWGAEPQDHSLRASFGTDARMSITIEVADRGEPYQGIVPLEGETISDAIKHYFAISEQLPTEIYLGVSEHTVAGLLLQRLPADERHAHDADGWARAAMLASTVTTNELLTSEAEPLLHAVFHEERVRLFTGVSLKFECSCSRTRTDGMLLTLGEQEVNSIVVDEGRVDITCEFCDAHYSYDAVDVAGLFRGSAHSSPIRH